MSKKIDDRPLDEIASDMLDWCVARGCQRLGETDKEYQVTCPNANCSSREKGERHKTFDVNKHNAKYNCQHCGLSGQGLDGPRGLIATLESGDFSPSTVVSRINLSQTDMFKPKEKAKTVMSKDELPPIAQALSKKAKAYLNTRHIPEHVYRDTDLWIFSAPAGTQFSFMKQPLKDEALFFPAFDNDGEVVHVHYKLLNGGYYMSPGVKPIYITKATALTNIIIVEGIFDALSVYIAGYQGAALLGHEITANHDLSIFEGKQVVILLDNDDTGKASVEKVASTLNGITKEVRIAEIPAMINGQEAKDPNDVLVKAGAEELNELIKNAKVYSGKSADNTNSTKSAEHSNTKSQKITADTKRPTNSKAQVRTNQASQNQPKKESGITFPQQAWRGVFETYRQAQEGTTEAPDQYHFGVMKTVAGIVVGKTACVWSGRKLFPNFYTVLIGPTTQSRKSTAASRGTSLLSDVDEAGNIVGADPLILTLRGLSTPAGLLAQLKTPDINEEGLSGVEYNRAMSTSPYEGYRTLIVINEFASLLRQAKKEAGSGIVQLLTDAYDSLPELHNPTKVDPIVAKNAVISMICLSTREWLENTLDIADVYGGYVCRNLFYDWTQTAPISNPAEPNQSLLNKVTMELQGIRHTYENRGKQQLKYQFDTEAQAILEKWYTERWYTKYPSEVIAASVQRIDENVRKLALLYAVLENAMGNLYIHADQLRAAMKVGEYWETIAIRLFSKFGFSKEARDEIRILEALSNGPLSISSPLAI